MNLANENQPKTQGPTGSLAEANFPGLDLLRFVSVVAIVWFHARAPWGSLAYSGLPALLLISLILPMVRDRGQPLGLVTKRRAERLLSPWVFWSLFYGAYFAQNAIRRGDPFYADFESWMIVTGPMVHLWYLPFAFCASMVGLGLFRVLEKLPLSVTGPLLSLGSAGLLYWVSTAEISKTPWAEWSYGAVALPLALVLSLIVRKLQERWVPLAFAAVCLSIWVVALILVPNWGIAQGIPYAIGTTLVCLGLSRFWKPMPWLEPAHQVTFGIYILHLLVFALVTDRILRGNPWHPVFTAVTATAISWVATWLLRKTPIRRFL